jgi:hypothetical protein
MLFLTDLARQLDVPTPVVDAIIELGVRGPESRLRRQRAWSVWGDALTLDA